MTYSNFSTPGEHLKVDQHHAVSENVVYPANLGRIRRYGKTRIEQALIEAIAGPEQHLMQARPYRLLVPIRCRVVNVEDSHSAAKYWRCICLLF